MRQQMVRQGDRLGALKMGVTGKDGLHLILRTRDERLRKPQHRTLEVIEQLDHEQTEVERDLIVPASRRMKLAGNIARARAKGLLDRGVDVLRAGGPRERARGDLARDGAELSHEDRRLFGGHDPLPAEHARVSDAAADVVRGNALVELER